MGYKIVIISPVFKNLLPLYLTLRKGTITLVGKVVKNSARSFFPCCLSDIFNSITISMSPKSCLSDALYDPVITQSLNLSYLNNTFFTLYYSH